MHLEKDVKDQLERQSIYESTSDVVLESDSVLESIFFRTRTRVHFLGLGLGLGCKGLGLRLGLER